MQKNEAPAYWALLGLSLALSVLALLTLIPNPSATKPNVLGYRSLCSFAPAATALCGILAGIACTLRNRLVSRRASSMRYRPPIVPAFVILLLAAVATVSGLGFGAAQSRFAAIIQRSAAAGPSPAVAELVDGTRQGSAREGEVSATVEARVREGRIEALRLVSGENVDGPLAETLFARIESAGGTAVDGVSGATASSAVLLKAVAAALR